MGDVNEKILHYFFSHPKSAVTLSELAARAQVSKAAASDAATKLETEGFLNIEQVGRAWRITCNQDHEHNHTRKVAYNLREIFKTGVVNEIKSAYPQAKSITLFGSYRKGTDNERSDLDLAIEVAKDKDMEIIEHATISIHDRKRVPVHLHVYGRESVDLRVFNNIANGIVLDGFLEVRP